MTEQIYKNNLEKFIEDLYAICDIEFRMPDEMVDRAAKDGIVIFKPHMGDNEFFLEGALSDICPQPWFGYQPQPNTWRDELQIHIDSAGFTFWEDEERHAAANLICLYEQLGDWMDIPHKVVRMKDAKHSRAWYLLFEKRHLAQAPEGSKCAYDRITEGLNND